MCFLHFLRRKGINTVFTESLASWGKGGGERGGGERGGQSFPAMSCVLSGSSCVLESSTEYALPVSGAWL